jgi:hypothetical protein
MGCARNASNGCSRSAQGSLGEEEGHSMKSVTIFIAFGLLAGIIQGIIYSLVGIETPKGLRGIVYVLPTYALGVLVGYYVLRR